MNEVNRVWEKNGRQYDMGLSQPLDHSKILVNMIKNSWQKRLISIQN